ncbi:MAG: hypothetical protein HZA03_05900 [Nitrospinae bacterium]|nr:hypothetical protein [Nitrospinota bacterium]
MKFVMRAFVCLILAAAVSPGCTKKSANFPETTPELVATRFFKLLADGGRLANQEAFKMVSTKYGVVSIDSFRKWTENIGSSKSKIKVAQTILPKEPNKNGDWVAVVKLEVSSPSLFDADFTTSSQMNLILDEKAGEWQVDFNAETIDETAFMKDTAGANSAEAAAK